MLVQTRVDPGFRTIDYDSKELRKPLRKAGNDVRKLARKLISRRSVSDAGDFPGRDSGEMQRSPSRFIRRRLSECRFITRHLSFMGIVGQDQKRWSNRGVTKNDPVRR